MMKAAIRDARAEDIPAMVDLLRLLFSIEADFAFAPERHRRGLAVLLEGCAKHRCVKVAETGGGVVGMCTGQTLISTAEGGIVALIEDVVVQPPWQGQGIGRRLLTSVEAWALAHGATRLQLLADHGNAPALKFYARAGWTKTRMICLRRRPPAPG
jgi:GNAT superfamily N-acetyltransferase